MKEEMSYDEALKEFADLLFCVQEKKYLQQRIDKAIEYMNNTFEIRDVKDLFKAFDDVENILRGEDNGN